jgi:hypothetical protein
MSLAHAADAGAHVFAADLGVRLDAADCPL